MGEGIVGVEREAGWAVAEFGAAVLGDARRTERLVRLAGVLGARPPAALADACDDPAMLKAAYRFLENGEIDPQAVLASHVAATVERARGAAVVLAVQDTTHVEGDAPAAAAPQEGLWVHSTLALTPDGMVQGVLAQEQWTRPVEEQGVAARRRGIARRPIGLLRGTVNVTSTTCSCGSGSPTWIWWYGQRRIAPWRTTPTRTARAYDGRGWRRGLWGDCTPWTCRDRGHGPHARRRVRYAGRA